jgi:hypothetical protein
MLSICRISIPQIKSYGALPSIAPKTYAQPVAELHAGRHPDFFQLQALRE